MESNGVASDIGPFAMVPEWLLDAGVSGNAIKLFAVLHRHEGEGGIYPSRKRLAAKMGCSVDTVDRVIKELAEAGAITIQHRRDEHGDPATNFYVLHFVRPGSRTNEGRGGGNDEGRGGGTVAALNDSPLNESPLNEKQLGPRLMDAASLARAPGDNDLPDSGRYARLCRAWERATGTLVAPIQGEAMDAWCERVPEEWVMAAIAETGIAGVRNWKYTKAILERWQREGRDTGRRNGSHVEAGARTDTVIEELREANNGRFFEVG